MASRLFCSGLSSKQGGGYSNGWSIDSNLASRLHSIIKCSNYTHDDAGFAVSAQFEDGDVSYEWLVNYLVRNFLTALALRYLLTRNVTADGGERVAHPTQYLC